MRTNIGVILAGGTGNRLGASIPKQFLKLGDRRVIEYAVDAFENHPGIQEITIVVHRDWKDLVHELTKKNGWKKVYHILDGGNERYESSMAAIREYSGHDVNLILHDAVRPFLSQRILSDICEALLEYEAIDVTVPCTDTIVEVAGDCLASIPDRSKLNRGQTPQAFRINVIADAYERALKDPAFKTSDDCGVVCRYRPDVPVYIVRGEERNMKITYPEDLAFLELLLNQNEIL